MTHTRVKDEKGGRHDSMSQLTGGKVFLFVSRW